MIIYLTREYFKLLLFPYNTVERVKTYAESRCGFRNDFYDSSKISIQSIINYRESFTSAHGLIVPYESQSEFYVNLAIPFNL